MKIVVKLLAVAVLAFSAVGLVAGQDDANAAKPSGVCLPMLVPASGPPDLVVCEASSQSVKIKNLGPTAANPFYVRVSPGFRDFVGCADQAVPAYWRLVSSLGGNTSLTIAIPWSSTDREVIVDYFNKVTEASELNNTALVPGEGSRIC